STHAWAPRGRSIDAGELAARSGAGRPGLRAVPVLDPVAPPCPGSSRIGSDDPPCPGPSRAGSGGLAGRRPRSAPPSSAVRREVRESGERGRER
ncbi:unnamed protein product, partial [Urochloa humidicola]